jgi:hypothetical protein
MVVRMKVGYGRAKPEFEDVALIATATGVAVHEVASRAEEAWRLAGGRGRIPPRRRPRHRRHDVGGMFDYDEAMTDLVVAYCRERLALDPVPLDFGGQARALAPCSPGSCAPRATRPPTCHAALRGQAGHGRRLVRQPALPVLHPGRAHQGGAPLRHVRLLLVAAGTSWLEAAGVVVAENQALEVLADLAGLPAGAGGCFVAGGSAGNLSALVVARDTAGHRRGGEARPARWSPSATTPTPRWARRSTSSASRRSSSRPRTTG